MHSECQLFCKENVNIYILLYTVHLAFKAASAKRSLLRSAFVVVCRFVNIATIAVLFSPVWSWLVLFNPVQSFSVLFNHAQSFSVLFSPVQCRRTLWDCFISLILSSAIPCFTHSLKDWKMYVSLVRNIHLMGWFWGATVWGSQATYMQSKLLDGLHGHFPARS